MSYATLFLTIVFMINLFIFLLGDPLANSPMLALLKGIMTGSYNINWLSNFFTFGNLILIGSIIGIVLLVSTALSPSSVLTGSFATFHVMTVIGIAIFISFTALPNFSYMGIPEPLATILNAFLGFMTVLSIFGLLRGGE